MKPIDAPPLPGDRTPPAKGSQPATEGGAPGRWPVLPPKGARPGRTNPLRLSLFDCVFVFIALYIPLGRHHPMLNSDGDLGRHVRVGETILERGIFKEDLFSHTMLGEPFHPFEWASQIFFALAHRAGGLPGVAVWSGLLLALTFGLVVVLLRRRGVDPLLAFLMAMAATVLASSHFLARPHLFTLTGAALLMFLLESRDHRRVWLFAPLFVGWANIHGGFLFGLVMIGVYLAGALAEARRGDRDAWLPRARYYAMGLGIALAASLATPLGPSLLPHVTGYLGETFLVAQTQEYQSPDFHTTTGRIFLVAVLGLLAALAHAGRRPAYTRLFAVLATLAFALHSARNIPLFALVTLPILALELDAAWRSLRPAFLARARWVFQDSERTAVPGLWAAGVAAAMAFFAWSGGAAAGVRLLPATHDPAIFPVEAVERARAEGLDGRLFNSFDWGGYILYAWPEQRVFIDAQTDFYGEALTREYLHVEQLLPGWRDVLERRGVSLVVVHTRSPLAAELAREPGWSVWHRDGTATVLRRDPPEEVG